MTYVPGSLPHRSELEERRPVSGTADRLHVDTTATPDVDRRTAARAVAALSTVPGATRADLAEIAHMLTDPVPFSPTTRGVR